MDSISASLYHYSLVKYLIPLFFLQNFLIYYCFFFTSQYFIVYTLHHFAVFCPAKFIISIVPSARFFVFEYSLVCKSVERDIITIFEEYSLKDCSLHKLLGRLKFILFSCFWIPSILICSITPFIQFFFYLLYLQPCFWFTITFDMFAIFVSIWTDVPLYLVAISFDLTNIYDDYITCFSWFSRNRRERIQPNIEHYRRQLSEKRRLRTNHTGRNPLGYWLSLIGKH